MIYSSNPQRLWWPWLLAGLVVVAAAFPFDNRVGAALNVMQLPPWKEFAQWCSKIGEGWVPAVIGIFLAAAYLILNRPQVAAKIFFVTLTCELTGLAVVILRLFFGRARLNNHDVPPGFYGMWHDGHWILGQFKFSSFPSGHAATAVGVAAAAWLMHRGWGAVLMVYALVVMWSRIALQCHHLSDVLASTVLSIALAVWLKQRLLPSVEFQFGNLNRAMRKEKF